MVRHAPIHRRSDHSDIAICCGRNVRGSSLSTSVVPLSNQVTTLNHKRFKGFKMFSDGHSGIMMRPAMPFEPHLTLRSAHHLMSTISAKAGDPSTSISRGRASFSDNRVIDVGLGL